ncbi:Phosphopantothenoylcysteine decarboxylase-like [Oopsacas minuta]|uniref:Phosphopantothenoylcysteine decarboxylase-like n=1 Tax=Oopsacas minuta TaxID=111878 RepID=A0AAV7KI82_9METZ|nr:Phosphopantothenoylcysteine decarboxylase-like [Oopsacas minuta]
MSINILVAATGSVAAIKIPELIQQLSLRIPLVFPQKECCIKLIATENSMHFFDTSIVSVQTLTDKDEWSQWKKIGDPVLHIELKKWADLMVVAPLDANTLSKVSNGASDNLVSCVARAWDFTKPIIVCPAMNTFMWAHPITKQQLDVVLGWGYTVVPCVEKKLACGDVGLGAMAAVDAIVTVIIEAIKTCKN